MGDGRGEDTDGNVRARVVLCTRDRAQGAVATVESILANTYEGFELLVIDQSSDAETRQALSRFELDPRFRYLSTPTRGLSRARNIGLMNGNAPYVLMTDDDCEVPADWVAGMVDVLDGHPTVGLVFGRVVAGPYDPEAGFVPVTGHEHDSLLTSVRNYPNQGIGAAMGLRKEAVERIGGFDPELGPGATFKAADDVDLALRLLLSGSHVLQSCRTSVVHHGFRTFEEGRTLIRGYVYGSVAAYAKLFKCGHPRFAAVLVADIWRNVVVETVRSLAQRRRPPVLGRLRYSIKGVIGALRMPVDRATWAFVDGAAHRDPATRAGRLRPAAPAR